LLVTTENLAEMLEVNPNIIRNWALGLGLRINANGPDCSYSEDLINLFKEVRLLILNEYTLPEIKEFLSVEIEYQNKLEKSIRTIIVEDHATGEDYASDANEFAFPERLTQTNDDFIDSFKKKVGKNLKQAEINPLFDKLLEEIKQSSERLMESEKKVYLLENNEKKIMQESAELTKEIETLKAQIEENNKKIKVYEEQTKRLNLMEVQLKILQLEKNRKNFWEIWK